MNAIEPMLIEVPGVPGKLRSQTLDEYMSALIPEHPARQELAQVRSLALEGIKVSHDLIVALQKIDALKKEIEQLKTPTPALSAEALPIKPGLFSAPPAYDYEAARKTATGAFACPTCAKTFTSKQGLALHITKKHPAIA